MTTKVVNFENNLRMITGKLAPYLDLDWTSYSLEELEILLKHVVRFEIEYNYRRHKDYKDKKGANVEVFRSGKLLKVSSLNHELLVIQDGNFGLDQISS